MELNDMVQRKVTEALIKELDIPSMVKEAKPQIEAEFKKHFARSFMDVMTETDMMYELVGECLDHRVYEQVKKHISSIFIKALKAQNL